MPVYDVLNLHRSGESYIFEPVCDFQLGAEILTVDRLNAQMSLQESVPTIRYNQPRQIFGIIGMILLQSGYRLIIITKRKKVGHIQSHTIWKVMEVDILPCTLTAEKPFTDAQIDDEEKYAFLLRSFFANTELFYSTTLDLTRSIQSQSLLDGELGDIAWQKMDIRFFANRFASSPLIEYAHRHPEMKAMNGYIIPCIEGFAGTRATTIQSDSIELTLISRRQWNRTGTRYHSRGLNVHGAVSNFVETEQILVIKDTIASYVQIRGSIPVFWRQRVNIQYSPPIEISANASTMTSFQKHFDSIMKTWPQLTVINLTNKTGKEGRLSKEFAHYMDQLSESKIKYLHFDFHAICGQSKWENLGQLMDEIADDLKAFSYFLGSPAKPTHRQTGVFRANCMDCLDRTNVVQSLIGKEILTRQLRELRLFSLEIKLEDNGELYSLFRHLWADNADALSLQYAGTGAQKTDHTRYGQRSIQGVLSDLTKSIIRYIKANFYDGPRQDAMDLFYGKYVVNSQGSSLSKPHVSFAFYLLLGMLACSLMVAFYIYMLDMDCAYFQRGILMACLFSAVYALRTIYRRGSEFVSYPTLVNEFVDQYGRPTIYDDPRVDLI